MVSGRACACRDKHCFDKCRQGSVQQNVLGVPRRQVHARWGVSVVYVRLTPLPDEFDTIGGTPVVNADASSAMMEFNLTDSDEAIAQKLQETGMPPVFATVVSSGATKELDLQDVHFFASDAQSPPEDALLCSGKPLSSILYASQQDAIANAYWIVKLPVPAHIKSVRLGFIRDGRCELSVDGKICGHAHPHWTSDVPCDAFGSTIKVSKPQDITMCSQSSTSRSPCTTRARTPLRPGRRGSLASGWCMSRPARTGSSSARRSPRTCAWARRARGRAVEQGHRLLVPRGQQAGAGRLRGLAGLHLRRGG